MPLDEAFLKETIEVWQPLSVEPLTMADAQEIAESMTGFFAALARCAKEREQLKQAESIHQGEIGVRSCIHTSGGFDAA